MKLYDNPQIWNYMKIPKYEMILKSPNMKLYENPQIWNYMKIPKYEIIWKSRNMKLYENPQIWNYMKTTRSGSRVVDRRADGRTTRQMDRHDEANSRF